jgi:hypothetical protein
MTAYAAAWLYFGIFGIAFGAIGLLVLFLTGPRDRKRHRLRSGRASAELPESSQHPESAHRAD